MGSVEKTTTNWNGTWNNTFADNSSVTSLETEDAAPLKSKIILTTEVTVGTLGVISNAIVIIVFASNKNYRKKIPIMFMINQVLCSTNTFKNYQSVIPI